MLISKLRKLNDSVLSLINPVIDYLIHASNLLTAYTTILCN